MREEAREMRGFGGLSRFTRRAIFAVFAGLVVFLWAGGLSPAFAQGIGGVEPTLEECRAFVEENGVPQTRPVWEGRGYSGWDVCLNMAYDGDLEGSFGAADANSDGKLDADEQRAYMDSVLGPVSDPDQTPLTVEKCRSLVEQHGIPEERPFVDWSNRGYGETEICQGLAYDGDLENAFSAWDANADGRLDRAEQSSFVENASRESDSTPPQSEQSQQGEISPEPTSLARDENVARDQYSNAGESTEPPAEPTTMVQESTTSEPTMEATEIPENTQSPAEESENAAPTRERGVLSAVNTAVEGILPSTGGSAILAAVAAVILIGGGILTYRRLR